MIIKLSENKIFTFIVFLLSFGIIVKLWECFNEHLIEWQNFLSLYLWKCFWLNILVYSLILFLSVICAKLLKFLSTPFIFIAGIFLSYFFIQINIIFLFPISETTLLRIFLVIIILFILYKVLIKKAKVIFRIYKPGVIDLLIVLWLIHAAIYFLVYNFNLNRELFADEERWIEWAKMMVNMPIYQRISNNLVDQSLAGLCGVPFVAALPTLLLGAYLEGCLFFDPIITILGIAMFLILLKKDKWCFLFFFVSLILTLNRHGWLRCLNYQLVYGQGITTVFFLLAIYELVKIKESKINFNQLLLLSFLLGLFVFSKPPMNYVFICFAPILIFINPTKIRNKLLLLMALLFAFIIRFLIIKFRLSNFTPCCDVIPSLGALFQYDFSQIKPMVIYLIDGYTMPLFFSFWSIVFIILTFKGKEFLYIIPFVGLVIFVFYLYITVFSNIEYESSARYLSQGMLALYYLGAIGFRRIIYKVFQKISKYSLFNHKVCMVDYGG